MRLLRLIPDNTRFDFVRLRFIAFAVSGLLLVAAVVSLAVQGLNLGIDFAGGILIEMRAPGPVDVGALRGRLDALNLGSVELQQFGENNDLLVRLEQQEGGEQAQNAAVRQVREALGDAYDYRRVEVVGPRVGGELFRDGVIAALAAVLMIAVYIAFRFEWQFGVSALFATFHDVITAAGLYSLFQLEFDMTAVAALLTLAGYSINDTVVVFDRIRETLRRRKSVTLGEIINESVNQTLSRTILTSVTVLLSVIPLLVYGGSTLFNFSLALVWGILVGTYSSIFVAASMLIYLPPVGRLRGGRSAEMPASAVTDGGSRRER